MILPIVLLSFLATLLLLFAVYMGIMSIRQSPKFELKRRLQRMARDKGAQGIPEDLRSEIIKETPPFDRLLARLPIFSDLDRKLDHAGLKISVAMFVLSVGCLALAGFVVGFFMTKLWWVGLVVAVTLLIIPFAVLEIMKRQRVEKFTELFPDALTTIARSLRAGHSFSSAVQLVGQEIPEPVGSLFKTSYDQQQLGLRITDTLANMNNRIESLDLRFFTTAVSINTDVGGNLAEVLDNLATTIRERLRIRRQVRVYTAQGRLSGYILCALPIVAFIMFQIMLPGYENELLKETYGQYALILAAVMQVIGFLVIRKIINIRI